jgi:hypothetical protein
MLASSFVSVAGPLRERFDEGFKCARSEVSTAVKIQAENYATSIFVLKTEIAWSSERWVTYVDLYLEVNEYF